MRLLEQLTQAKRKHEVLLAELRQALLDKKGEVVTALILSEAAALRKRDDAEVAFRRHSSTAHSRGKADARTA